jgi:hypothetical protein
MSKQWQEVCTNTNPSSKDINIHVQEGLDLLKLKCKYYGHYSDNLLVLELIEQIEILRKCLPF